MRKIGLRTSRPKNREKKRFEFRKKQTSRVRDERTCTVNILSKCEGKEGFWTQDVFSRNVKRGNFGFRKFCPTKRKREFGFGPNC